MRISSGLRAFHYTALTGSTTAAACALNVSQPTVSAHIKNLERSYGVKFFTQSGRNLVLTGLGQRLAALTDQLFELENEADRTLREVEVVPETRLRIGTVSAAELIVPIAEFWRRNANVHVAVVIEKSEQIANKVRNTRLDVGLVYEGSAGENLSCISLGSQPFIVISKHDHPLVNRGDLKLADLDGQAMVAQDSESATLKAFESGLRAAGAAVKIVMEIPCHQSLREAVAYGVGLGVVSHSTHVPDERVAVLPIVDLMVSTHSFLICREDRKNHPLVAEFLAACYQSRYPLTPRLLRKTLESGA